MSKVKFQHYVPRFYLQNFASKDGLIWVLDKTDYKIFRVSPINVAGEKYFYDVKHTEDLTDETQYIELALQEIESEAAKLIKFLVVSIAEGTFTSLHVDDKEFLALYITLQILRVPEYRKQSIQTIEGRRGNFGRTSSAWSRESAKHFTALVLSEEDYVNGMAEVINNHIWVFAINNTAKYFYTSDNPVLFKSQDNSRWLNGIRLDAAGVQIIFPLSGNIILYTMDRTHWQKVEHFDGGLSPVKFTEHMVDHENSGQVGMSTRYIYSQDGDFNFAKMFCDLHPETRDPDRQRVLPIEK